MFDKNSGYERRKVDLMQLINEPMLKISFDVSVIPTSTAIDELSSDEESIIPRLHRPSPSTDQSNENEKASDNSDNQAYPLPSPTPGLESNDSRIFILTPTGSSENSRAPSPKTDDTRLKKFAPTASASKDISSKINEANVIPEGVKRVRQPSSRKQAYSVALHQAEIDGKEAYYAAFSVHIAANQYYLTDSDNHHISEKKSSSSTRLHRDSLPPEPQHYGDLRGHPHADGFKQAMRTELDALKSKSTWTEISYLSNKTMNTIPTTWVFKYKFDDQGFLIKYKARLCARGDLQSTNVDTYAATLASRIFRALMALVNAFDLETRQYDAINAFVNSEIDEPIYFRPPAGWTGASDVLLLFHRALYGLKQSSALWCRHFSETLIEFGLHQVSGIECLFVNDHMLCFFFVDDIAVLYDRRYTHQVDEFQKKLFARYEMRYIGEIEWFFGIRISRDRYHRLLILCQDFYIDKLAVKFNIDISKKAPGCPIWNYHVKNTDTAIKQDIFTYQQKVESINYAAVITRPDVAYAASKLSEFLTNPSHLHLDAADRVLSYLAHTKHLGIKFSAQVPDPQTIFLGSSDASYADDPLTRYSSQRYGFMLFNGLIDWKANKQKTVTLSSTEAELLAVFFTNRELIW